MKTTLTIVAIFALGLGTESQAQGRSDEILAALATRQHVSDEVLVQYLPGVSGQAKANARRRVNATFQEWIVNADWRLDTKGDLELVKLPPGLAIAAAMRGLQQDPNIEFVEPNWIYQHQATSNDPYYTDGRLWGMYGDVTSPANQYGCQAGEAWAKEHTGASTVWIGIIDEGYMHDHPDLTANAGKNPGEVAGNRLDDDGNGYVDDVYGWDFAGNNNSVFDGVGDDHGTHVAGTIGAVGGNAVGVAGVCWTVKLMNAKFLGTFGGTTANAIKAVDYFTDLKTRQGLNFVASNNSWGGGGYSKALYDAIERANAAGILFVAAAGNGGSDGVGDNNDTLPHYPSSYDNANIIAVAAITSSGAKASFSNYGATSVDLGAPGSGIVSTVPVKQGRKIVGSYASYSGTSMATPHVTGACALYAAAGNLIPMDADDAAAIKKAILDSVVPTPSLAGKCVKGGRLNVGGF